MSDATRHFYGKLVESNGIPLDFNADAPTNGRDLDEYNAIDGPDSIASKWPDPLTAPALHGIAGEYVRIVEPASETDTAALLLQFLVATGNAIGHRPFFMTEDTPHYLNSYVVLIGTTSKSRKGTSWGRVKKLFRDVDEHWTTHCISSGLSSGEGLIEAVRDATGEGEEADPGVQDKRLLVCQGEFCGVLRCMERDGNTLSIVLRDAWDGVPLRTMTRKNNALRSTDSHISMIGHITRDELRATLTETDKANGFGNRILWACIKRSKELPDEVVINDTAWDAITARMQSVMSFARKVGRMRRSEAAQIVWRRVYHDLSEGQPGMFGALTSRAEAQVVRLSCLYALLDHSEIVEAEHLEAGLAVWRYCEQSARFAFGHQLGDPVADEVLRNLKIAGLDGLTRTQISGLFGRNKSAARIAAALATLQEGGLVTMKKLKTDGRAVEVWFSVGATK